MTENYAMNKCQMVKILIMVNLINVSKSQFSPPPPFWTQVSFSRVIMLGDYSRLSPRRIKWTLSLPVISLSNLNRGRVVKAKSAYALNLENETIDALMPLIHKLGNTTAILMLNIIYLYWFTSMIAKLLTRINHNVWCWHLISWWSILWCRLYL